MTENEITRPRRARGNGFSRVVFPTLRSCCSHHYRNVDQLSSLSVPRGIGLFCPSLLFLLLSASIDTGAQVPNAAGQHLLHGSIFTAQGQPAVEAAVELRDLRGIKIASALTDGTGNFEINSGAPPGEYVFLVSTGYQIKYEQVLLAQPGLDFGAPAMPMALPAVPPRRGGSLFLQSSLGFRRRRGSASRGAGIVQKTAIDEAEREIDGALRADPAFAQAFAMRAFIRLAQADANGAVEAARRAVSLDAEDAESFIALAMSYNSLREFQEAENAAWRALSLRPDSWQGRFELAKAWCGQSRFVVALREMDELIQDFPDVYLVRARMCWRA